MTRFVRPALREGTINTQRNLQSSTLQCNDGAGFLLISKGFQHNYEMEQHFINEDPSLRDKSQQEAGGG